MIDPLPKCLFKEGTEPQVDKLNNTCRSSILTIVKKFIRAEYDEILADPLFAQVMAIHHHKLRYSGRVVHSFICKQLLTAKIHEVWFHFSRRPLRFSMQEFHAITGLKVEDEPDLEIDRWRDDKGFWSRLLKRKGNISLQQIRKVHLQACHTWSHIDRLRLVFLCVIAGLIMAKGEKVWIPHKYIKLVMDFEKMRKYPWGLHSFDELVSFIIKAREKVKTQKSYVIDGFSYALKIWLMEAIPDIGSLLGQKLRQGVTSMRCRNWKGCAKVSYEDIITIENDFGTNGDVFPYIFSSGNGDVIVDAGFERADEMKDERVDLIMDMVEKKYDWKKHVWAYQETVEPFLYSSEKEGLDEKEAGETSKARMEVEVETTPVSAVTKRNNMFQDTGAESRKKRLLCQRSTEKYRVIEEEMKSYIQVMFKSSFAALGLEVREIIDDRFAKLEEKIFSSQPQVGVPAYTHSPTAGGTPAYTHSPAHGLALTEAHASGSTRPMPAITPTQTRGASAPAPTPVPSHTSAPTATPSRKRASGPSRTRSPTPSHTGSPASAAKTRSQTKETDLSDVFASLHSTLDVNLSTQEYLQKTMGNLTQESHVNGFDPSQDKLSDAPHALTMPMKRPFLTDIEDPEVRRKDKDYKLVFVPEDLWSELTEWSLNPKVLQLGPSKFDADLAKRVIGPKHWFKNYEMDAMMYFVIISIDR